MTNFLFDTPYWFLGLLILAGGGLLVTGNNRQDKSLLRWGLGILVLTVALGLFSFLVDTEAERVIKRTRQLVGAVEKKDRATVADLLHPHVLLYGLNKEEIVDAAGRATDDYRLKNVRVTSIDAAARADSVVVVVDVAADIETSGWAGTSPSSWELVWFKAKEGYLLRDIAAIKTPGVDIRSSVGRWKK